MTNIQSIPDAPPSDIIKWAEENVKVDGHSFEASRTPQLVEPLRAMTDIAVRIGTLIKPVQSGGSTVGEILLAWWCMFATGKIQFNWQDDLKAKQRWLDRILPLLKKVNGLRWAGGNDDNICNARFVNATLEVQGVKSDGALDSETIPFQLNEEIHLWAAGLLDKARRRQTRVWNSKALDISNAGIADDQLEAAWEEGTMEVWQTYCPGCGKFHAMQFRWDDKRPELGGLRFDSKAGKAENGKWKFNRIIPTIRYQMPCGHVVADNPKERKQPGKYIVTNDGALTSKRSWTFDAVSVPEIQWADLVSEWLKACHAKSGGDLEPMKKFVQERECRFWSDKLVPRDETIIVNTALIKNREGLKGRANRFWAADRQRGRKARGELPHFWLVIRDVMPNADSMLVWEGLVQTETDLFAVLEDHKCGLMSGAVDCTWDTENMRAMCFRRGCNGLWGSPQQDYFRVKSKLGYVRRVWSEPEPLYASIGLPHPKFPFKTRQNVEKRILEYVPDEREPRYWSYHKSGILRLLSFLKNHTEIKWEVPGDVSDDYRSHMSMLNCEQTEKGNRREEKWTTSGEDHMLLCEAYIAKMIAMSGILGNRLSMLGIQDTLLGAAESQPSNDKMTE